MDDIVYAPHYYEPKMVDGSRPWDGDPSRMRRALERTLAEARRVDVPVLLGEWGAIRRGVPAEAYVAAQLALYDEARIGALFWSHEPGIADRAHVDELARPGPRAVAGTPLRFSWDGEDTVLELVFRPDGSGHETVVYLPDHAFGRGRDLRTTDPSGTWTTRWEPASRTLRYTRTADAPAGPVTLEIRPAP